MTFDLFSGFFKKENSTLRPDANTTKVTVTGHLKEPCSVLHPVISLQSPPNPNQPPDFFRYAYIPLFSRYYWVDDWTWEDGLWTVHLDVDVLASYRDHIGAETEYILRTDSNTTDYNGAISDTMYPATTDFRRKCSYTANNIFVTNLSSGCYVVGIISSNAPNTSSVGAISYYAMTPAQFNALKNMLFSPANLEIMDIIDSGGASIADVGQEIVKTMYNPYQYIVSCLWFPFDVSLITTKASVSTIPIGWWNYTLSGYSIPQQILEVGEGLDFTDHPQSSRGTYLNYAPYTVRTLIGRFGTLAINNSLFKAGATYTADHLSISYFVDIITGQCRATIEIQYDDGTSSRLDKFAERFFLLAVPIQLAQVGVDYLGAVTTAVKTGGDIASGAVSGFLAGGPAGAIAGAIANGANGIYNTIQSTMPQLETSGNNGSFLSPSTRTMLLEQYFLIADEDIHHKGRPLCAMRQINTLSGYVLCAEGDLDLNAYDSERQEVKRFLTTGFFWE